ncbi:MAG: aryl-sulfate sulfotransferase [Pseudomonadota bacterium]
MLPRVLLPLLMATGCTPSTFDGAEVYPFEVTLALAEEIPTVVVASWSTDLEGITRAWVAFGPTEELGHEAAVDLSAEPPDEAILVGSKGEAEVHVRVFAETAEGTFVSEEQLITTGPVPAYLPNLSVTHRAAGHWDGYLVTGFVADEVSVILDEDGDVVWWHEAQGGGDGPQTGVVLLGRTLLARDGRAVLYGFNNIDGDEDTAIRRVSLDGAEDVAIDAPFSHHDFVDLPDGTIAYLAYNPRVVEDSEQFGDSIVEIAPDGRRRIVWDVWDYYDYVRDGLPGPGASWPHGNAIDYIEEEDAYLVGFLTLGVIILVDRVSGEPIWTLGGPRAELVPADDVDMATHHQFDLVSDHLVVFDNGGIDIGATSRAWEVALDLEAGVAEKVWEYAPEPALNCTNLGDVDRLENGNTLVTFSVSGQIHEVTPAGQVVWRLEAAAGGALSYAQRVDAIGPNE